MLSLLRQTFKLAVTFVPGYIQVGCRQVVMGKYKTVTLNLLCVCIYKSIEALRVYIQISSGQP